MFFMQCQMYQLNIIFNFLTKMESANCAHKIKALFCETANHLAQLFKHSLSLDGSMRIAGHHDAYKDVLEWAKTQNEAGLKNVPVGALMEILHEKIEACDKVQFSASEVPREEQKSPGTSMPMSDIAAPRVQGVEHNEGQMTDNTEVQNRKMYTCKRVVKGSKQSILLLLLRTIINYRVCLSAVLMHDSLIILIQSFTIKYNIKRMERTKPRNSVEEMEEDIKNFDLSQPVLFCRTPPPKTLSTDKETKKPTPVPSRDSPATKTIDDVMKKCFSRPMSPVATTGKYHIVKGRSTENFYYQLLEYFVYLLVKFRSLTTVKREADSAKYEDLGHKIIRRTQELMQQLVFLINNKKNQKITFEVLEENWSISVDPCKNLVLFLLKNKSKIYSNNKKAKSPRKTPQYIRHTRNSPTTRDINPELAKNQHERHRLEEQIAEQSKKEYADTEWNKFMEKYYRNHKQHLLKHAKIVSHFILWTIIDNKISTGLGSGLSAWCCKTEQSQSAERRRRQKDTRESFHIHQIFNKSNFYNSQNSTQMTVRSILSELGYGQILQPLSSKRFMRTFSNWSYPKKLQETLMKQSQGSYQTFIKIIGQEKDDISIQSLRTDVWSHLQRIGARGIKNPQNLRQRGPN
eukprot:TRINITY_DN106736_c0_g1_i2.p1 TRINITY_DN106736_c0_g1~~TRINITY_DN106736_c0_g1_i2.p1  ORF type:complete len:631 (-),score=7.36 TRINITY_DN106736_c0_g1_i2:1289-3181(-)